MNNRSQNDTVFEFWCRLRPISLCLPSAGHPALGDKPPHCPGCLWGPAAWCPTCPRGRTASEIKRILSDLYYKRLFFFVWFNSHKISSHKISFHWVQCAMVTCHAVITSSKHFQLTDRRSEESEGTKPMSTKHKLKLKIYLYPVGK